MDKVQRGVEPARKGPGVYSRPFGELAEVRRDDDLLNLR